MGNGCGREPVGGVGFEGGEAGGAEDRRAPGERARRRGLGHMAGAGPVERAPRPGMCRRGPGAGRAPCAGPGLRHRMRQDPWMGGRQDNEPGGMS